MVSHLPAEKKVSKVKIRIQILTKFRQDKVEGVPKLVIQKGTLSKENLNACGKGQNGDLPRFKKGYFGHLMKGS